jgi:hypothetical protein
MSEQQTPHIESPPPAETPRQEADDPCRRLHQLAAELMRAQNRAILREFLQLRRTVRI